MIYKHQISLNEGVCEYEHFSSEDDIQKMGGIVKMPNQDNLIPAEKRILIHLLGYNGSEYQFKVPYAMTRKGISDAIGVNSGYIPRLIKKLVRFGYIRERTGRIKNGQRKQKYALLTHKGKEYTKEIKNEMSDLQVTLIRADSTSKTMSLMNMISYLNEEKICPEITMVEILGFISKDKTFEIKHTINSRRNSSLVFLPKHQ